MWEAIVVENLRRGSYNNLTDTFNLDNGQVLQSNFLINYWSERNNFRWEANLSKKKSVK